MLATLILENGTVFRGTSIGDTADCMFETVFNTSMTGYQEILTDPSYAGQGIVMSYPLIGNYGVNDEDNESAKPWASALIVRSLSHRGSNFRCQGSLDDYLKQYHIAGIEGVDTRALTKILRNQGTMNGIITCTENFCIEDCLTKLKAYRVGGAARAVTRTEKESFPALTQRKSRVALMDYGVRTSVIDGLRGRGCEVTAFPAGTPAGQVLTGGFDGVLLSDGPGDPAEYGELVAAVKELYGAGLPLFGLGLGHQLLALAAGGKTERMLHGHRGSNYPVRDVKLGRVFITAQNHGYQVVKKSLSADAACVSHVNVNDGTVEGLEYQGGKAFSVQFSPDSVSGAASTGYLFDKFVSNMGGDR